MVPFLVNLDLPDNSKNQNEVTCLYIHAPFSINWSLIQNNLVVLNLPTATVILLSIIMVAFRGWGKMMQNTVTIFCINRSS